MNYTPPQIVAEFYEASVDAGRWPQALLALGNWMRADAVMFGVHDFEHQNGYFQRAVGIAADLQGSYRRGQVRSNPWLQSDVPFRRVPAVVRGSELIDDAELRNSAFHRNWLRSSGLFHHVFLVLARSGPMLTFLALARRDGKADFFPEEIDRLNALMPFLMRALDLGPGILRLRAAERAAARAVEAMPIGVAVLDREGMVLEANRAARLVIDAGEGLTPVNGGLATDVAGRRVKLRDLLVNNGSERSAAPVDGPWLLPVPRPSGQRPLTLLMMPLDEGHGGAPGAPAAANVPAALLFIGDPERPAAFDQARIARLYGLSRAESRVAALLASGYRLEQVADRLDIAYETVRKHLKQIFGKTGTFRQAELVRILVTGPAGLSV